MKLIINITDSVEPEIALTLVRNVILGGRVSKNKVGEQFCWVTTFKSSNGEFVVYSKGHRKGSETESFYVSKDIRKTI